MKMLIKNLVLIIAGFVIGVIAGKGIKKKEHPKVSVSVLDVPELQQQLDELKSKIEG